MSSALRPPSSSSGPVWHPRHAPPDKHTVLYRTLSVCPRCVLVDRTGVAFQPSSVIMFDDRIWLVCHCGVHRHHYTLYCSSASFFKRIHSFTRTKPLSVVLQHDKGAASISDMEDMVTRVAPNHYPLIVELPVFANGAFISDEHIRSEIQRIQAMFPPTRTFVLKPIGKVTTDLQTLNQKVIFIEKIIKGYPILFEVSYERLAVIADLPNSAFLSTSVYPALKYYLRVGDEELCMGEIQRLLQKLSEYKGIQAVVTISVERPFPRMDAILRLLRASYALVRVVIVSLERPPKDIMAAAQATAHRAQHTREARETASERPLKDNGREDDDLRDEDDDVNSVLNNIDVWELVQHLEQATDRTIVAQDLLPVSVGSVLEPFLGLLGYGRLCIRPSPFCGIGACLVNAPGVTSVPATRFFQIEKFFDEVQSLLPQLEEGKVGFFTAQRLKRAMRACMLPGAPDLYDYLVDKDKAAATRAAMDDMQFLVVHNNMDIAAIDIVRRCHCAVQTAQHAQPPRPSKMVASCTGCI